MPVFGDVVLSVHGPAYVLPGETFTVDVFVSVDPAVGLYAYGTGVACNATGGDAGAVAYVPGSVGLDILAAAPDGHVCDFVFQECWENLECPCYVALDEGDCGTASPPYVSVSLADADDAALIGPDQSFCCGGYAANAGAPCTGDADCTSSIDPVLDGACYLHSYLSTFEYEASADASGVFEIDLLPSQTYIFDSDSVYWPFTTAPLVINVGALFGDVDSDGDVDIGDIVYVLEAYSAGSSWPDEYPGADIHTTFPEPVCGPDGLIKLTDIVAVLLAFAGTPPC